MDFRIESDEEIVRDELGRIMTQIPEVEAEFAEEMMEIAVEEIQRSARENFNNFSGNMRQEISMDNVVTESGGDGTLLRLPLTGNTPRDADYLEWHERAESGHYVEVSSDNKPIQKWVRQYYDGEAPEYIYVSPTPFVKPAVQRIARRARSKAKGEDNSIAELAREIEN